MKEVRIQIPDNCDYEIFQDGNTYVIKEKEQKPPRSWKEFCEKFPVRKGEAFIDCTDLITPITLASDNINKARDSKCWCTSKEEAEAFLALMQLRQLRKAWVGDWKPIGDKSYVALTTTVFDKIEAWEFINTSKPLSFPTKEMAKDFFNCFGCLCETAKILL